MTRAKQSMPYRSLPGGGWRDTNDFTCRLQNLQRHRLMLPGSEAKGRSEKRPNYLRETARHASFTSFPDIRKFNLSAESCLTKSSGILKLSIPKSPAWRLTPLSIKLYPWMSHQYAPSTDGSSSICSIHECALKCSVNGRNINMLHPCIWTINARFKWILAIDYNWGNLTECGQMDWINSVYLALHVLNTAIGLDSHPLKIVSRNSGMTNEARNIEH